MIGDKLSDVEAGRRARCQSLLALAGYGKFVVSTPGIQVVAKCNDVYSTTKLILDNV
jgi:phosphoglycolate phosphatase-like HAD superfamily hydrolase